MCEFDSLSPHNFDQISVTSDEQLFMRRLLDLKARENQLKCEMMIFEEQEREMAQMLAVEQALCRCSPQNSNGGKTNENIYSELSNLQTNLKMCVNEMEGPLAQELALERVKARQLENYLASIQETIDNNRRTFMTTMGEMKNEFQSKCSEMVGVKSRNADLKRQARELECKCKELEGEMFQEKLKEAVALITLSQTVGGDPAKHYCFCSQAGGDQPVSSQRSPIRKSKPSKKSKSSQTLEDGSRKPSQSPKSSKSDIKSIKSSKSKSTSTRSSKTDTKSPRPSKDELKISPIKSSKSKSTSTGSSKTDTKSPGPSKYLIKSQRLSEDELKISPKPTETGNTGITTELQVEGDLDIEVVTEIIILDAEQHETSCDSATIEIVTQGPIGTIETTMVYTDSGNIEVVTEIREYDPEDGRQLQRLPPPPTLLALPCHDDTCEKKSRMNTIASRLSQCDDNTCVISRKRPERRVSERNDNKKRKVQ